MNNVTSGLIQIVIGGGLIYFRKPFAEIVIGYQIWAFRMPFGKREVKMSAFLAFFIGLLIVITGILTLIGVLKVRG